MKKITCLIIYQRCGILTDQVCTLFLCIYDASGEMRKNLLLFLIWPNTMYLPKLRVLSAPGKQQRRKEIKKKLPASSTELFVIFPRQILSPFSMSNLVKDSLANNRKSRRLVKVVYEPIRHHLQQIRWRCAITLHNVIQYMIKSVGGCVPIVAVVVVIAFPRYNIIYVRCSRLPYAHCDCIHLQANTRHLPASQYLQIANFPRMRSEYILDALCVRVHCYRQNCTRHKLQCATHMRGKLFRCNDAHCTTPPVVI